MSNSGMSKQGAGPWVCPMQSWGLRGTSSLVPLQLRTRLRTSWSTNRELNGALEIATQPRDCHAAKRLPHSQVTSVLGRLLKYQLLTNKKMPILGHQPLGSPSGARWVISEDRVAERQTKHPVTFLLEGAEQGAGEQS